MYFGAIVQSLSSFAVGLLIAFIASWRLSLVTLLLSPLLMLSGLVESQVAMENDINSSVGKKKSDNILFEVLNNIKFMKSLNAQKDFFKKFQKQVEI